MHLNMIAQLSYILPEIILTVGALSILMLGSFSDKTSYKLLISLSIGFLVTAMLLLVALPHAGFAFGNALKLNGFGRFMKILVLLGSISSIILSIDYSKNMEIDKFELPVLYLLATVGMFFMISAANMLTLYLGLEMQSLCLYALAAFDREKLKSSEAGIKYFILGALSSGLLLYGISLLYGYTGQIGFAELLQIFKTEPYNIGVIFGLVLVLIGVAFKISAVPFHMWTPDVYEGAPTPVTAFFAGAPKIAAFAVLTTLVTGAFAPLTTSAVALPAWKQILLLLSLGSMLLGAFSAIGQTSIKRVLAYSSISHVGYILLGLLAGNMTGTVSVLIYLTIYLITIIGFFAFLLSMQGRAGYAEDIYDLSGIAKTHPYIAVSVTILLFSLAGIPPLAGFFAKWYSFIAAVRGGFVGLAIIGVISSVIGAFYYLRLIKIIWFDETKIEFLEPRPELKFLLGTSSLLIVFFIIWGHAIYPLAQLAAISLFQ
ncbi:NADH-quinone oxidoreductase subunit NuoN [Bartonella sp. TP]|uniref:NADH-quinone oxidoreductase subunit NuoN n=1 Tax=Bartonella sp. TP TaxID=3057550 RepID=UPI0025B1181C|nr:NADH-quinone oxidoreductase subunit NuoN [Bartonella sp. TP]WJW79938.1 NADH-quinone oxidoreductase subunit NuoN [Bartonella sp. TP]